MPNKSEYYGTEDPATFIINTDKYFSDLILGVGEVSKLANFNRDEIPSSRDSRGLHAAIRGLLKRNTQDIVHSAARLPFFIAPRLRHLAETICPNAHVIDSNRHTPGHLSSELVEAAKALRGLASSIEQLASTCETVAAVRLQDIPLEPSSTTKIWNIKQVHRSITNAKVTVMHPTSRDMAARSDGHCVNGWRDLVIAELTPIINDIDSRLVGVLTFLPHAISNLDIEFQSQSPSLVDVFSKLLELNSAWSDPDFTGVTNFNNLTSNRPGFEDGFSLAT